MSDSTFTEPVLHGFYVQLAKEAGAGDAARAIASRVVGSPQMHGALAGLGSGAGLGLGVGAVGGAALGGAKAYREARAEGQGRGSALGSALGGTLRGAGRGAVTGAALGAGAGALAGAARPARVAEITRGLATRKDSVGGLSRFGQRQVHSLTGWKPGATNASVESIGAGAANAREALHASTGAIDQAKSALTAARAGGDASAVNAAKATYTKALGGAADARSALGAAEVTQNKGMTSLPGLARNVGKEGLLPTLKAGIKEQWRSSGPKGKALLVGLPAAQAVSTLASKRKDGDGGVGKGEALGRLAGGTLGMMAAPLPLAGSMALGSLTERAGGAIGRGVDRLHGKRPAVPQEPVRPPATAPGDTGQVAVEHVYGTGYGGGAGGLE
jgi:hypothetical protein